MFSARDMMTEEAEGCAITDRSLVRQYVDKHAPLLEGIEDELDKFAPRGQADYVRAIGAFMLENQMRHMRRLNEDTRAISVGPYMKFILPVIRRSAVRLVATQICSVQPMTGPIGGIAFWRPRYATEKGAVIANSEINKYFNKWYSSNFIDGEPMGTGDGVVVVFNKQLRFPRTLPGTVILLVNGVQVATDNGAGGFTNLSGVAVGGGGSIVYTTGITTFTFGTAPASGAVVTIRYRYDNEGNSRIAEVSADMAIQEIRAESRKLKYLSTLEANDDAKAMWGRDLDADFVAQMSDEMTTEIDREIAGTALNAVEPGATLTWDRATPSALSDPEHLQSLVTRLSEASQLIARRTQRSAANWIITSTQIAALLDTMPGFSSVDEGHVYQGGLVKSGVLNRKWVVYVDPMFPADTILLGYQGPSILDTGLIWSPYVAAEVTPAFVNPSDGTVQRLLRTRHKVTLVRPEFFAKIVVTNLN